MKPAAITLIFLAFAVVMFVTEKIPLGLTSMIVCIGLVITSGLNVNDAFSGCLSNTGTAAVLIPVVIGIAAKSERSNTTRKRTNGRTDQQAGRIYQIIQNGYNGGRI